MFKAGKAERVRTGVQVRRKQETVQAEPERVGQNRLGYGHER